MYHPTPEQAEADRKAAYEAGVPHGFVAPGDRHRGGPTITLRVVSELHTDDEYGEEVGPDGQHRGGPFTITVSPKMRVEELRHVIRPLQMMLKLRLGAPSSLSAQQPARRAVRVLAGKGFGKQDSPKRPVDDEGPVVPGQRESRNKTVKFKGKRQMRQGPTSMPAQQAQPGFNVLQEEPQSGSLVDQIEFEQRLKALKAETEERQKEAQRSAAASGGILSAAAPQEDIYANPQPLSKTLLPQDDSGAVKEYEGAQFGPSQAGLAVAAVLLGAVFLVTSGGGDFAPAPRASSAVVQQQGQAAQLGEEQRADLQRQLEEFEARLAADSSDADALEGAAVLHFRLGEYAAAEKELEQLVAAKPGDADVLRVLAESQAAQGSWPASVASYRKAWEASGRGSLEILQGLAGALVADGKEADAVAAVQAAQAVGGSSGIGEVELALLSGKTYATWRGHAADAVAVYDGLIERFPEDFRPYLAKGLLLKDQGREGDATRYFIQAKFYAKGGNRKIVESIIESRQ
ncbi:tetratricopeptide repeat-containing [Chlorella sorokiniana]|uniref:Tetratricopeptide repeat-containing n=1 Tax=Chlorella sorokiniana TaxID=3076 RepID=A0A2P6TBT5_CHLSO|nr:tetratricopeptide repeat-containing [Chlorella sorokiniana]|eukprot:PRW18340.1 tetratricopeptide repeat-containing [Chlorella sorokiniana]